MTSNREETILLKGNRFDVHMMHLEGSDGKTYEREVIRHPGAVVLIPRLDPDTVVLIENTRPTVGETLLELPAGTMEWGEDPMATAQRELIEETGYRADRFTLLHQFYSAPGISDELMYLYIAEGLSPGEHQREAVEQIENRIATRSEMIQWIAEGKIRDGKTLIGLYAFLHSAELK
ncbi:MAG: NUDIX hydrolase [Rubripirellula sp.]